MEKNKTMSATSLLCVLLTVLFVGLKLTNIITWSWIWVLSPLWIPICLSIIIMIVCLLLYIIVGNKK